MSKPEVVGYESVHRLMLEAQMEAIRVRQAHEAARAADKARIAELTTLLADIKAWDIDQMLTIPLAIRKRMQEVLAQQGKEGET
ncbi:MAG: hypothetical protein CMK74_02010 [Pseudomonadales bacterium]|nr:hypothetical protein [Pseudomonadales bacterium]